MKNWKTTATGYSLALINLFANGLTIKQAAVSIGMALLGQMAKDYNISNAPAPLKEGQKVD